MSADEKRFATLAARFALTGHALLRATPGDTRSPFYVMRWGWLKPLASLDAAEAFLSEIGGAA